MAVADEHAATVIGAGHSGTSGTSVLMTIVGARVAPNSGHAKMGLMTDPAVAVPEGYPQLLEQLKAQVRRAGVHASRVVNTELLTLYWDLGRAILDRQDAEGWGTKVIDQLAVDLRAAFPEMRGLSRSNLKYMRQMASTWPRTAIGQQAVGQLPWGISQPASCSCGSAVQRFSGSAVSGGAVRADRLVVALPGVAVAVLNEEAARAAELIGLLGNDPDRELLTGQVSAGQLHRLGGVDLIHRPRPGVVVHDTHQRSWVVHQLVSSGRPGGVVISGHHTVLTEEKKIGPRGALHAVWVHSGWRSRWAAVARQPCAWCPLHHGCAPRTGGSLPTVIGHSKRHA